MERIMLGIVMAGFSGCDESILYLSCKEGESHKVFSVYSNISTMGLLFSSVIYTIFIKDNYRAAGLLTTFSYGLAAVLAIGLKEVRHIRQEKKNSFHWKQIFQTLRKGNLILLLLAIACIEQTHQTVTVFLNQLLYLRSGILISEMGFIYVLVNIIGFLGIFSHKLTKRLGEKKIIYLLYSIAACSCIILAFWANPVISVLGIMMLRLIFNFFYPLQMEIQNREIITSDRATALSLNSILINGIGATTNVIFGRVADVSLTGAMIFGAVLCLLGMGLFNRWYKKN